MTTREIWRDVPSVPGIIVSNKGRVMVMPYRADMPHGGERPYGGHPHAGVVGEGGRLQTYYKGKVYRIHLLVAEAFHGPKPFDGAVVMHVNENNQDNRAVNLRWGTQKENMNAPGYIEYCKRRTGKNSPRAKWLMKSASVGWVASS